MSAMCLSQAGGLQRRMKHVDHRHMHLQDMVRMKKLELQHIPTTVQPADFFTKRLDRAGLNQCSEAAKLVLHAPNSKAQLGNRVLWDRNESKDVYTSTWQLPELAWHGGGQAGEGPASQGECNAVGGVHVKVSPRSGKTDWATVHRRLGHVAMPLLKKLEKDGAVKDLKLNGQPPNDNCEICLLSKFTRFPFHGGNGRSKKPLELVHMDLVGPLPVQGHKGERYFLNIVDDWSRLMWAYPLKQKGHAASMIREDWLPFMEKQAECMVKRIRTDRGGEFLGAEMMASPKKQGIQRELTTAYTPQSNGVAEWANRTILQIARALLMKSWVGNSMWPHAQQHTTVARSSVLTKVGDELWVPLERWLGRKPPVDMLRVFDCMAVAHVPKKYRSKLGASAIWCPEAKVSQEMEKITMQLDLNPSVWEEGEEAAAEGGDGEKVQEAPADGGGGLEVSGSTSGAAGPEGEQPQGKAKAPTLLQRRKPKGVVMKGWETPVSRPGRTRMATMKLTAGADVAEQQLGNKEALLILPHGYDPDEEDEPAYCFLALAPEDPSSMEEALAGPNREKWLVSRDAEYQSLLENGTWDLVVLPEGKKAVQCKTSSCDESLFLKGEGEKLVLFLVYVDGILLFSNSMKEIQKVQQQLMKNFKCKTFGELDISFYVGQLARVVQNPSEEQVDAAERMVKYMNSHPSIGFQYSASAQVKQKGVEVLKEKGERLGEGKLFLTLFTDATWASEKEDSSSLGGYIFVVGEGPVCWRSKKQMETSLSSLESEYIAMFHGVKEVIWLRRLLEVFGQE
ncbi:unnamed protein product [Closterium sp. NIES-54]